MFKIEDAHRACGIIICASDKFQFVLGIPRRVHAGILTARALVYPVAPGFVRSAAGAASRVHCHGCSTTIPMSDINFNKVDILSEVMDL